VGGVAKVAVVVESKEPATSCAYDSPPQLRVDTTLLFNEPEWTVCLKSRRGTPESPVSSFFTQSGFDSVGYETAVKSVVSGNLPEVIVESALSPNRGRPCRILWRRRGRARHREDPNQDG